MNNKRKIKQDVSLEEAKEQVKKVCRRLALLHLAYAKTIINELGDTEGRKLVLKAIKEYGRRIGENIRENLQSQGKESLPENYIEDLPFYGMHEKVEEIKIKGQEIKRAYGCVMGKFWRDLGEDKVGRLYCYVDPAKYMAYNPNFALVHTKSIPDGDEYCEFIIKNTTESERKDFVDNDKDWSYIDK